MFEAVTFDLWNTLISEGSGGLIRPRATWWHRILKAHGSDIDLERLAGAHEAALAAYQAAWRRNEQFGSAEATDVAAAHLGLELRPDAVRSLVETFHHAGLECEVQPLEGAVDTLKGLQGLGIKTAIICDIGLTPSSALRHLLTDLGILEHVDVECWSDERGVYKPDPAIFAWTLQRLGTTASGAMHVGDRLRTDVAGARAAGLASVRYTGVYEDPDPLSEADFVISRLRQVLDLAQHGRPAGGPP